MQQLIQKALTVQEAAELAGYHYITIYRWIYSGILSARKTKTGRYRIAPEDLRAVLEPPEQEKIDQEEIKG